MPTARPRLQVVFDPAIYKELQAMQESTGKSLSQLAGELVVDGLNARRATNPDASAVDLLKRALVMLEAP